MAVEGVMDSQNLTNDNVELQRRERTFIDKVVDVHDG